MFSIANDLRDTIGAAQIYVFFTQQPSALLSHRVEKRLINFHNPAKQLSLTQIPHYIVANFSNPWGKKASKTTCEIKAN